MIVVLIMSTDADIISTTLNAGWHPIRSRNAWAQVSAGGLAIPNGDTIVVIAHGHGTEIGNATAGVVDIDPTRFLQLVRGNMAGGANPGAIYISTCNKNIAEFAANVRIRAENVGGWGATKMFGHSKSPTGPVPPPGTVDWIEIL